jgi:hypothetical protein
MCALCTVFRYLRIPLRHLNSIKSCQLEIALNNEGVAAAVDPKYSKLGPSEDTSSILDQFRISSPYTWDPE